MPITQYVKDLAQQRLVEAARAVIAYCPENCEHPPHARLREAIQDWELTR